MTEQLKVQREHDERRYKEMDAKLEAQRQDLEAKLEAQRQEVERLRNEKCEAQRQEVEKLCDEAKLQRASNTIDENLDALQSRLQELHAAQLLSAEEISAIEDTISDCIDLLLTATRMDGTVDKVVKLVNMSSKMKNDASFARQLKRRIGQ